MKLKLECGCEVEDTEYCTFCKEAPVKIAKMLKGKWTHLCDNESCIIGVEFVVDDAEFMG